MFAMNFIKHFVWSVPIKTISIIMNSNLRGKNGYA